MDQKFQLFLLGVPEMVWQTQPFGLARRQARALLYRLAEALQPVARDQLIFLLWPDVSEVTARRNLNRLLSYARQALPQPDLLLVNNAGVILNPDLVWSDTVQFATLCATEDLTGWETAASLYRSRFLDGFTLPDSPEFDQWLSQTQRQYERIYLDVLRKLVAAKSESRNHAAAIHYAQKYLAADDLAEDIHRHLISLYAAAGGRSAALRQFEQCAMVLERELGVPPLPETRAVYEAARDGTQPPPPEVLPKPEWTTLPGLDLPLIGRDEAWQALTEAYRRYQYGGVIFISGEAGVGKSRLMQEFATAQSGLVLTGNSQATGQALPYQPLAQALRQALPLRDRWTHTLPIWLAEVARLLPELRAHFPDLPPPVEVGPQQAQARLFEALTEVFASLTADSPLLLCLDDVHWADEATVDWLQYVTKRLAGSNICIVGTYRSHRAARLADWRRALNRAGLAAPVLLNGLSETAVAELLHQAGVDQATAQPLAGRIHSATGGNAFFVLETIRELLETGQRFDHLVDLPLPQTVRDAVLRRAARLTPLAQQVVTVAAVLSPNLTVETLVEVSGRGELETVESVEELLAHQLLQADGHAFRFQHDLARQTIYEDISLWRRRLLHRRAAEGLEQLYQTDLAPFYPSLTHHWSQVVEGERADPALISKAIEYLHKAGEQAVQSAANEEAISYFRRSLALLKTLPDTSSLTQQEFELQMALCHPLLALKGYAAQETVQAVNRAAELAEQIEDAGQIFPLLYSRFIVHFITADNPATQDMGDRFLSLALQRSDSGLHVMGYRMVGLAALARGDFHTCLAHLDQALMVYDPQQHRALAFPYGQEPGMAAFCNQAWCLWLLGYPDRALAYNQKGLEIARTVQQTHPYSLAYCLAFSAVLHQFRQEVQIVHQVAEENVNLCQSHNFPYMLAWGLGHSGWSQAEQGQVQEGIATIQAGLSLHGSSRSRVFVPYVLSLLVEAHAKAGQWPESQRVLAEALALIEETGEHFWEAELYRLKGELLLMQGKPEANVEANFQQAIAIARRQETKSLELRATIGLARLWHSQGSQDKRAEAHHMLSEIYNWFTEGFDTVELKAARVLLEELL